MRVLLGSGEFRTEERVRFHAQEMRRFLGDVGRILFVPHALQVLVDRGLAAGYELDGIHRHSDPRQAVQEAAAIYVGGGNTFRLLDDVRERVREGVPYLGVSAGTNVACPHLPSRN